MTDLSWKTPEGKKLEGMLQTLRDENAVLREALKVAYELILELRGYCRDGWDWKYKDAWDEDERKIKAVLRK